MFPEIPYKLNYWQVKYLAICLNDAVSSILTGRIQYCVERSPCLLLYKWLNNGVQLIWRSPQDSPNCQIKTTVNISAYAVATFSQ